MNALYACTSDVKEQNKQVTKHDQNGDVNIVITFILYACMFVI